MTFSYMYNNFKHFYLILLYTKILNNFFSLQLYIHESLYIAVHIVLQLSNTWQHNMNN